MARRSEEQWNEIKFKVTVAVVLFVVVSTAVCLGPGLRPIFLEGKYLTKGVRKNYDTEWAPIWLYRIAWIEENSFRREKAQELWEEFYLHYSGDEGRDEMVPVWEKVTAEFWFDSNDPDLCHTFMPWVVNRFNPRNPFDETSSGTNPRPKWKGGLGAQPHKLLPKALLARALYEEDHKQYLRTRHLFRAIKYAFSGTPEANMAEQAILRDASRSF